MHCFSSTWETAKKCLDTGYYISFAGNVTYKSAIDLREVAKRVPYNRLLVETDSPYLAPQPFRGSVNTPRNVTLIYRTIAEVRGTDPAVLAAQIAENAKSLFGHRSPRAVGPPVGPPANRRE